MKPNLEVAFAGVFGGWADSPRSVEPHSLSSGSRLFGKVILVASPSPVEAFAGQTLRRIAEAPPINQSGDIVIFRCPLRKPHIYF